MAQLLVRNISDELVKALKLRAAAHGVSTEEEHRRILVEAVAEADERANELKISNLLSAPGTGETDDANDWLFDRNDPRNARTWRREQGLFDD